MKRPNWKLYHLQTRIEFWLMILFTGGAIMLLLFIYNSTFPAFKYSSSYIKIITYFILITLTTFLIITIKSWSKKSKSTLSNRKKIKYSLSCLLTLFFILSSIEYLSYIDNKEKFNIENNYIKDSTRDRILNIRNEIRHCTSYINAYNHIHKELKGKEYIKYNNINDLYYTIINNDTIEFKIHKKSPLPGEGTNFIYINKGLNDAEDVGILLNNKPGHISHPTSKTILESMKQSDSINADDFRLLVIKKIEMYQYRIKEYEAVLENEPVITFGDFVIYSIFNPSITGNNTHIFIRLIFLLQAIVVTFFSGYIYQTLYKILDGEDNKKQKA